jgi:hypothetical protein
MAKQTPLAPATTAAPVGSDGDLFQHAFKLASALIGGDWQTAFEVAKDMFSHLKWQDVVNARMAMGAAGPTTDPAAIGNAMKSCCEQAGGQPAMPKGHPQMTALAFPWQQFAPYLLQALIYLAERFLKGPVTPPGPAPVQTS